MGAHHRSGSRLLRPTAKNLLVIVAVLAIASSLLAACGDSKLAVVGTWNAVTTTGPRTEGTLCHRRSALEFLEDGTLHILVHRISTVAISQDGNQPRKTANWSWLADDILKIEFPEASYLLEISLNDDELILRDRGFGGNAVVTFERDLSKKPPRDG